MVEDYESSNWEGILSKIRGQKPGIRISMYADAAALFLAPAEKELTPLAELLTLFGGATGMRTIFFKNQLVFLTSKSMVEYVS